MGEFYTTFNEIRSINPGCADDRSCSCMEFQKLGIPCTHAIAAALKANVKVAGLVDETYTMNYLKSAYASHILPPVELDSSYQLSAEVAALCLNPPATRRPPGRPRKKRFFSRGEMRVMSCKVTPINICFFNLTVLTLFYVHAD